MTASIELASAHVQDRTAHGARFTHQVSAEGNVHLAALMEEPSSAEGMKIQLH